MLLPKDGTFKFRQAQLPVLQQTRPKLFALLTHGVSSDDAKKQIDKKKEEKVAERAADKTRSVFHPAWLITVGIMLVCLIILTWTLIL